MTTTLKLENIDVGAFATATEKEDLSIQTPRVEGLDLSKVNTDSFARNPVEEVKGNLSTATGQSPEEHAKNMKLAREASLPVDAVASDPKAVEAQLKLEQIDLGGLSDRSPGTAVFLTDFSNAVIAQDDIKVLEKIEGALGVAKDFLFADQQGRERQGEAIRNTLTSIDRAATHLVHAPVTGLSQVASGILKTAGLSKQRERMEVMQDFKKIVDGKPLIDLEDTVQIGDHKRSLLHSFMVMNFRLMPKERQQEIVDVFAVEDDDHVNATFFKLGKSIDEWMKSNTYQDPRFTQGGFSQFIATDVPTAFGNMFGFMAAAAATRGVAVRVAPGMSPGAAGFLGGAAPGSAVHYAAEFEQALEKGATLEQAYTMANIAKYVGMAEGAPLVGFLDRIDKRTGGKVSHGIKEMFKQGAEEAIQETVTELANAVGREIIYSPGDGVWEIAGEAGYGGTVGFTTGALMEFFAQILIPGRKRMLGPGEKALHKEWQREEDTAAVQFEILNTLHQNALESQTKKLDAETFEKFVREADGDRDTTIFIDSAQLSLYIQDMVGEGIYVPGADPAFDRLVDKLEEARESGEDVSIPVTEFMADIAGTEHFEALVNHMVLRADTPTQFRQEQVRKERESFIDKLVTGAQESVSEYVEAQEIFEEVKAQLIDTGTMNPVNAGHLARVVPAWATVFARENNMTVQEAYEFAGLKIVGPQTGRRAELTEAQLLEQRELNDDRQERFNSALREGRTGFEGAVDTSGNVDIVHYSHQALQRTDPTLWGKGLAGRTPQERSRIAGGVPRTYFGVEKATENPYRREQGLGATPNFTKVPGELIYNPHEDVEKLWVKGDPDAGERAIRDAGYMGYMVNHPQLGKVVALFESVEVSQEQTDDTRQAEARRLQNQRRLQGGAGVLEQSSREDGEALQKADLQTFTREGISNLLNTTDWVILTAENPGANELSEEENQKRNEALENELKEKNLEYVPIRGKYSDEANRMEHSFAVVGIDHTEASRLGTSHGQESVLTRYGLIYQDDTVDRAVGVTVHKEAPDNFFSMLPDGTVFTVDLVFNREPLADVVNEGRTDTLSQTETSAFKRWFGDSKVVDENGKPLVVYHGTRPGNDITEFEAPSSRDGIYFTPDQQYAEGFTEELFDDTGARGAIYPVYLSVKNPQIVRVNDLESDEAQNFLYRGLDRAQLEDQGYDGAILYIGDEIDQVVAFRPEQIKSAIGNTGAFDPNDPNILRQEPTGGMYSAVERAVEGMNLPQWKKGGDALGKDVWAKLKSEKGIKKEELHWLGVEEFLTADPSARFTREGVLEYVRNNGVNVVEVVAQNEVDGEEKPESFEWQSEQQDFDEAMYYDLIDEKMEEYKNATWNRVTDGLVDAVNLGDNEQELTDLIDEKLEDFDDLPVEAQELLVRKNQLEEQRVSRNLDLFGVDTDAIAKEVVRLDEEIFNIVMHEPDVEAKVREWVVADYEYQYNEDPVIEYTDEATGIRIIGSDEQGYDIIYQGVHRGSDFIDSFAEAEVQAQDVAMEEGLWKNEDAPDQPRWEQYITEGTYANYREFKYTLPEIQGDFFNTVHFPDRNLLTFLRTTTRNLLAEPVAALTEEEKNPALPQWVIDKNRELNEEYTDAKYDAIFKSEREYIHSRLKDLLNPDELPRQEARLNDYNAWEILYSRIREDGRINPVYQFERNKRNLESEINQYVRELRNPELIRKRKVERATLGTFFIDEFQSDWHQKGRQVGYRTGEGIDPNLSKSLDDALLDMRQILLSGGMRSDQVNEYLIGIRNRDDVADFIDMRFVEGEFRDRVREAAVKVSNLQQEYNRQYARESSGITDAPFKDDAWLGLGLKRALIHAAEEGHDAFAWADAAVLADRWSSSYDTMYTNQYDKKMPSIIKKLTGQTPMHMGFDGEPVLTEQQYLEQHEVRKIFGNEYAVVNKESGVAVIGGFSNSIAAEEWLKEVAERGKEDTGYWVIKLTPELKTRILTEGFPLFQRGTDDGARGYYDMSNTVIRLTEASDLSTFLHEFAHFMYDMERKVGGEKLSQIHAWTQRNAKAVAKEAQDYLNETPDFTVSAVTDADITTFIEAGTTGEKTKDEAILRAMHEQFARGFETYVMEGKAPSIELRNVFRTFARWLHQVYESLAGIRKVNLDDQMRQVFDRLLATEEQIAAAEARGRYEPMFTDAAMAGMTEAEFAAYQEKQNEVKDKQHETLRNKLIRQLTRQTAQWWAEQKADIMEEEYERFESEPVYRAVDALRNGTIKLDLVAVRNLVGEERTDKRGRKSTRIPEKLRGMTVKGGEGAHPDEFAAMYGYGSGAELLADIIDSPTLREAADTAAEARMVAEHGDIMHDGSIETEADDAVRNEERGELLLAELKALSKATNVPAFDRMAVKELARDRIAKLAYREIHPAKYRKAEIRAAQEAATALAEGDKATAAEAKTRQVLNYYLGMAAQEARDDVTKIVDRMGRYNEKRVREAIQKAGNGYWGQLVKILGRFEFRKSASMARVDRQNQALVAWVTERFEEDGDHLILSPAVLDESYTTHWKNIPYGELQGIRDSVKNIEHVARYSNKLDHMQEEVEFSELLNRVVTHMDAANTDKYSPQRIKPGKVKRLNDWSLAQMTKVPWLASWLDGGERVGLMYDVLIARLTDAVDAKYRLMREIAEPVRDAIKNMTKADRKRYGRKIFIPEIKDANNDGNLMGHQVVAVALNVGNAGNLRKLLLGEGWANPENDAEISVFNTKLQAVLKHMTKADWDLVQKIWDQMDLLYPKLAEVHRKSTGLVPPKVEPVAVPTPFGTYRGGYYPVKYDPDRDHRAERQQDKLNAQVDSMFNTFGSIHADVVASATETRTGHFAPIKLDLNIVTDHFHEVIHYITHHEPVRQINKLITNKEFAEVMKRKMGKEEYAILRPWLNDVAKDGKETQVKKLFDPFLGRLRFGLTIGVMGFKASTGIIQYSGLSNTAAEVGSANLMRATRDVVGSVTKMKAAWEFANSRSKVLSHRMETMDREIRSAMGRLKGERGILAAAQEASMKHIALIQTYNVDLVSWHAAYIKSMREDGDEVKAARYGDWVVENVQGSGLTMNMSQIMREKGEAYRMFTMFMTFFSSMWNAQRDTVRGARSGHYSTTNVAAKAMFIVTVPVLFEQIMRQGIAFFDPEDEDEWLQALLTELALFPLQSIPLLRDAASATTGEFGYNMSPAAKVIEQGTQTIPEVIKRGFTDEEITRAQAKGATKFIGAVIGVPGVNQMWATGEHIWEVMEEGEDLTIHQLMFGPERD